MKKHRQAVFWVALMAIVITVAGLADAPQPPAAPPPKESNVAIGTSMLAFTEERIGIKVNGARFLMIEGQPNTLIVAVSDGMLARIGAVLGKPVQTNSFVFYGEAKQEPSDPPAPAPPPLPATRPPPQASAPVPAPDGGGK